MLRGSVIGHIHALTNLSTNNGPNGSNVFEMPNENEKSMNFTDINNYNALLMKNSEIYYEKEFEDHGMGNSQLDLNSKCVKKY